MIVYHRHGARLPFDDPLSTVSWDGECSKELNGVHKNKEKRSVQIMLHENDVPHTTCHNSQLTNFGRKQLKTLGKNLRELYFDQLGGVDEGEFRLRVTNVEYVF